jgi:hypothetical protein
VVGGLIGLLSAVAVTDIIPIGQFAPLLKFEGYSRRCRHITPDDRRDGEE